MKQAVPSLIKDPPRHRHSLAIPHFSKGIVSVLDVGGASYTKKGSEWSQDLGAPGQIWEVTHLNDKVDSKRKIYTINVKKDYNHDRKPDQYYDGLHIPFKDNSFDSVTSIDVFEHVIESERLQVLSEMIRVAKSVVILVFPFYSASNKKMEEDILKDMVKKNIEPKPSFIEHRHYELPTISLIESYLKNNKLSYSYRYGTPRSVMKKYYFFQNSINSLLHLPGLSTHQIEPLLKMIMDAAGNVFSIPTTLLKKDAYRIIFTINKIK